MAEHDNVWENYVGNRTVEEFMTISAGHEAPWTDSEIETASRSYAHEIPNMFSNNFENGNFDESQIARAIEAYIQDALAD